MRTCAFQVGTSQIAMPEKDTGADGDPQVTHHGVVSIAVEDGAPESSDSEESTASEEWDGGSSDAFKDEALDLCYEQLELQFLELIPEEVREDARDVSVDIIRRRQQLLGFEAPPIRWCDNLTGVDRFAILFNLYRLSLSVPAAAFEEPLGEVHGEEGSSVDDTGHV